LPRLVDDREGCDGGRENMEARRHLIKLHVHTKLGDMRRVRDAIGEHRLDLANVSGLRKSPSVRLAWDR
jgi:hypothetical protein